MESCIEKEGYLNGGTITLVDNTEITEPLALTDGKSVTLNLGGKTLIHSGGTDDATCSTIKITNGTLTIDGTGTIDGGSGDYTERNVIWAKGTDSKVIIKGGNFKVGEYTGTETGWYDCIYGNADINGSLNIMRKYTKASPDELLFQGVEGLVFNPRVVQL